MEVGVVEPPAIIAGDLAVTGHRPAHDAAGVFAGGVDGLVDLIDLRLDGGHLLLHLGLVGQILLLQQGDVLDLGFGLFDHAVQFLFLLVQGGLGDLHIGLGSFDFPLGLLDVLLVLDQLVQKLLVMLRNGGDHLRFGQEF